MRLTFMSGAFEDAMWPPSSGASLMRSTYPACRGRGWHRRRRRRRPRAGCQCTAGNQARHRGRRRARSSARSPSAARMRAACCSNMPGHAGRRDQCHLAIERSWCVDRYWVGVGTVRSHGMVMACPLIRHGPGWGPCVRDSFASYAITVDSGKRQRTRIGISLNPLLG